MPPKEESKKPKKLVVEACGCGSNMFVPKPKGKALPPIPLHHPECRYQQTSCVAYPHLPPCEACQYPCKWCLNKYRWCPHCWETPCQYRYKRVIVGQPIKYGEFFKFRYNGPAINQVRTAITNPLAEPLDVAGAEGRMKKNAVPLQSPVPTGFQPNTAEVGGMLLSIKQKAKKGGKSKK